MRLARSGNFSADGIINSVKEGEKVLTELTDFEKACFTLANQIKDKANSKLKRVGLLGVKKEEMKDCIEKVETATNLMWISIKERLGESLPESIEIREGWKIVETSEDDEKECDCSDCPASCSVSMIDINEGVMIIGINRTGGLGGETGFLGRNFSSRKN